MIEIPLSKGYVTFIDDIDADIEDLSWYASFNSAGHPYARWGNRRLHQSAMLSRVIMARVLGRPLTDDELVDHINHDTLDNRRANLRIATRAQNSANSGVSKRSKTGYKGVTKSGNGERFMAFITYDRKTRYLGTYDTPEEAHGVYMNAARKQFGEYVIAPERAVR